MKSLFAIAAIAVLGAAAPALGADYAPGPYTRPPVYAAPPVYPAPPVYAGPLFSWTGFYIGGHVGGAVGGNSNFGGLALSGDSARLLVGLQAGADWQFASNWVAGVEAQYSWLGGNTVSAVLPAGLVYNTNQRAIASLTGRIGYAWGPSLVYVKGGFAYSDYTDILTLGGAPTPFGLDTTHSSGYTLGVGAEYMFAPCWSAKVEYQYYNFGSSRFVAPAVLAQFGSFTNDDHSFKVGVNYHFNWGGPVAPSY
jgi:outer membrane immunogenic protein